GGQTRPIPAKNFAADFIDDCDANGFTYQSENEGDYSRSKSRTGLSAGPSRAFLSASSNLRARTSSFLLSASHDSRNLSSRRCACSAKIRAASEISTSGAAFIGGVCDNTVANWASTTSFDWQQGQT